MGISHWGRMVSSFVLPLNVADSWRKSYCRSVELLNSGMLQPMMGKLMIGHFQNAFITGRINHE